MKPSPCQGPSLSRAFQRHKEHTQFEASSFGGSHNYKTKQNKLPSFIDRLVVRNNAKLMVNSLICRFALHMPLLNVNLPF